MKRAAYFIACITAVAICNSQTNNAASSSNLSRFSSAQLQACYEDKSICGTSDSYAISDELTKRLPAFSTEQLVACFGDWKICGVENDVETGWAVSREVARRGQPDRLLAAYWTQKDEDVRDGIVHAAYWLKTPEVQTFMKKVLATGQGNEDDLYWPADYLAKSCDSDGLKWLSERQDRPEGCILWAPTVALFGKCKYRPAIPYLIENSLQDACLNIVDAAAEDLHKMYPEGPRAFHTLEDAQNYYCRLAKQEGIHVACEAK